MNSLGSSLTFPYNIFFDYEQLFKNLLTPFLGEAPDPSLQHFFYYEQAGEAPHPSLKKVQFFSQEQLFLFVENRFF